MSEMDPAGEAPLPRASFAAALRGRERYYHIHHPYQRMMNAGELNARQIRGWVANRYYYQVSVPRKDAALLANCPEREIRRRWLQRLRDHDGEAEGDGGIEAWIRLAEAVGLSRDEIESERHVLPGVRFAVDAYVHFVRDSHWLDGVASSLTELFAPTIHRERLANWPDQYPWIDPQGLAYFRQRIGQADRDVEHGLEIVLDRCTTGEFQQRALRALDFKLQILWSMLDAMYLAYVADMPPFFNTNASDTDTTWTPEPSSERA